MLDMSRAVVLAWSIILSVSPDARRDEVGVEYRARDRRRITYLPMFCLSVTLAAVDLA